MVFSDHSIIETRRLKNVVIFLQSILYISPSDFLFGTLVKRV